ncbi:MAG: translocation protein TolB [Pedosphaera sp.]|nr:translocation protein TolB [Pedosphaera sp.]
MMKYLLIAAVMVVALSLPAWGRPKAKAAKPKMMAVPPGKPEIFELQPRGMQRGMPVEIKLIGTNLSDLTELKLHNPKLAGELIREDETNTNEAWIRITAAADLPRGAYEISVKNTNSESSKLRLYVDDLAQVYEAKTNQVPVLKPPVSFWGTLDPAGDTDEVEFEARAGESFIFDLAAKTIGSKANAVLSLFDKKGVLLASNNGFDGGDPLLNFRIPATGRYRVRISEEMAAGSKEHFYRLSMGAFAEVVACYPLSVAANQESDVELIGFNLPPQSKARVKAGGSGEVEVPVDLEKFHNRRPLKVLVGAGVELREVEPNDTVAQAMAIPAPASVNGRIDERLGGADADLYRFEAHKGQRWIIETAAAQRGSPVDTKIEILQADGKPVERLVMQATRNSAVTFRSIDANNPDCRVDNWQEMELNEYFYMQGEICRIFRMPQGPDSGFLFYANGGKRQAYFDSSATAHALDEPCYVVEPHLPGDKLESNGLPVFPVVYANDDDGERKLGVDSRVHFSPPADGTYLIRVTDTRGHGGERFVYQLVLREARPDFKVTLNGANPTINAGSGKEFSVAVDRVDGFTGEIKVDIANLPSGFRASTPLTIEAGHNEAKGTITAALDATTPNETNAPMTRVTATALIDGKPVTKEVNHFGKIKVGEQPKLFVALEVSPEPLSTNAVPAASEKPVELTIAPGQSIPAWLKVRRNGHEELITFTVNGLPHGVIVDNIGLSGVLIAKGENERQIFLKAAKWVSETDCFCHAVENQAGRQTSPPVLLHVRNKPVSGL